MINKHAMGIKAFFFDSIGHLPRNCLEVGAGFEGSGVWVIGYIYKRAENQIFNLLWVSWAGDPLVAVSTAENQMPGSLISAYTALKRTAVKKESWDWL